jgi:hypothetical protein
MYPRQCPTTHTAQLGAPPGATAIVHEQGVKSRRRFCDDFVVDVDAV